ncbi:hypothetical protein [Nostoc sp.]
MSKLIRRALIASGLVIGAAVAFSPTAFADSTGTGTSTENYDISGSVTPVSTVTKGTLTNTNLNLNSTAIAKVADGMTIYTNSQDGAVLNVAVTTELTDLNSNTIPTYVQLVNHSDTPPTTAFVTASDTANATGGAAAASKDLYVRYAPTATQVAGTYTGTITLTLQDN